MIWTQIFGIVSVLIGLYYSSELDTGSGSMIALVSAIIFALTAAVIAIKNTILSPKDNIN
jgi:ABC-type Mn2+/Zn2+ transport system permease subunit